MGQFEDKTTTQVGVELTNALIDRCAPLVDGKPLSMVIEAFGSAMVGILAAVEGPNRRGVAMRYCARVLLLSDDLADEKSNLESIDGC